MIILLALGCGILFGAGLAISGMINPQKVLAFLDVGGIPSGTWDPTLGVVFAAALMPMFVAYDPDIAAGTDNSLLPLVAFDFTATTDGNNLTAEINAAGLVRAA